MPEPIQHMAEGSVDGTLIFVISAGLILVGAWLTNSGFFSNKEGSDENGDVKHSHNPTLFDSATRRARPGNDY